jgi:hypothetical protein
MFDAIRGKLIFFIHSYILFWILTFFRRKNKPHYFLIFHPFIYPAQFNHFVNYFTFIVSVFSNTFFYIRVLHDICQNYVIF